MLARTLRQVAVDLLTEVRRLDRRITDATKALSAAVAASGTNLTDLHGIGDVVAAKILGAGAGCRRLDKERRRSWHSPANAVDDGLLARNTPIERGAQGGEEFGFAEGFAEDGDAGLE